MSPADFSNALLLGVAVALLLLVALWLFYDRRDLCYFDRTRRRTTFHCLKCDHVYTAAEAEGTAPCPRCGHRNPRLRF